MEREFFGKLEDIHRQASEHFDVIGKNEKDLMATTKNLVQRTRMQRDLDWGSEDFRKRILTQDYGNYEKYEDKADTQVNGGGMLNSGANKIVFEQDEQEKMNDVGGRDTFQRNYVQMMRRLGEGLE